MKTRKAKPITYPEIHDKHAMVRRVEEGLPVLDVVRFSRQAGFTNEELARLIQVPARTYARRVADKGRLTIHEGERAARLMRIFDRAKQLLAPMRTPAAGLTPGFRPWAARLRSNTRRSSPAPARWMTSAVASGTAS